MCKKISLVVGPSSCDCRKHEQGVEWDVLQWFFSLSVSEWTVKSEKKLKNILVEAIKGTINLEVQVSFSNGKTCIPTWITKMLHTYAKR